MKSLFKVLALIALVVMVGYVIQSVFSPNTTDEQTTQEEVVTEAESAVPVSESFTSNEQLVERIIAFEVAYNSKSPTDTTETLTARIKPYVSTQFLEQTPLDFNSGADIALRENGDSIVASVSSGDVSLGEPDGPDVAYPYVVVHLKKLNANGGTIKQYEYTSSSLWKFDQAKGWLVFPSQ